MLDILKDRTYRRLFLAQVVALVGTGLAMVALGLQAYDLSGGNAALVLGTIFAIKMVAYVTVAPEGASLAERLPRRTVLVALDLVHALVALSLPFVTEVWQAYALRAEKAYSVFVMGETCCWPKSRTDTHSTMLERPSMPTT